MNKKFLSLLLLLVTLMLVTACGGASGYGENEEVQAASADEHDDDEHMHDDSMQHIHADPPEEFASLTNPEAGNEEAVATGEELFEIHCATCHGPQGRGDGEGAADLDPKPANLTDSAMMAELSDGYLFWRISKGGAFEPFNSAMPSWEQAFTEAQRWQLVSFVRTLSEDDHHEDEAEHLEEDDHPEDEDHHEGEEQHPEEEHMEGDEHTEEEHIEEDEHTEEEHTEGDEHTE